MKQASMLVLALVVLMCHGSAGAGTTTPIVANDVGHWLNLEHRTGKLAPEIADNPRLLRSILVVERSLAKIDTHLDARRGAPRCQGLSLPYIRVTRETVSKTDSQGYISVTTKPVQVQVLLEARVCTTIEQRAVLWEVDGALLILSRPRNELGTFPRTLYALYQVSGAERARWSRRVARGKISKPPRVMTLYQPPMIDPLVRVEEPLLAAFGAEFGRPPTGVEALAKEHPTIPRPPEPPRRDR